VPDEPSTHNFKKECFSITFRYAINAQFGCHLHQAEFKESLQTLVGCKSSIIGWNTPSLAG